MNAKFILLQVKSIFINSHFFLVNMISDLPSTTPVSCYFAGHVCDALYSHSRLEHYKSTMCIASVCGKWSRPSLVNVHIIICTTSGLHYNSTTASSSYSASGPSLSSNFAVSVTCYGCLEIEESRHRILHSLFMVFVPYHYCCSSILVTHIESFSNSNS